MGLADYPAHARAYRPFLRFAEARPSCLFALYQVAVGLPAHGNGPHALYGELPRRLCEGFHEGRFADDVLIHNGERADAHDGEPPLRTRPQPIRRYLSVRRAWLDEWDLVYAEAAFLPGNIAYPLQMVLDSARFGFPVEIPRGLEVPDTLAQRISHLLSENVEHSLAWNRFDDHETILSGEELIQFFQQESLNEIALKAKIPLVFYFLTLVLLLSTFFFIFRSKT